MNDALKIPDLEQRARALDPARSFIVQAPAGSGKTELLIQRVLALLGTVDRPEEIAAITFTIKAAAEMRLRVFEALRRAREEPRPAPAHEARTWDLASAALARNDALGWKLEETGERLRVQTIDALCASLTRQMPVLSRFGGQPESVEDASGMYIEAARALMAHLEGEDAAAAEDVAGLLRHVDNDAGKAERLLADMLASRDHWMHKLLGVPMERERLEEALREVRGDTVARVQRAWPQGLAAPDVEDTQAWIDHGGGMLTSDRKWRKSSPEALKQAPGMLRMLQELAVLPPAVFDDTQWDALQVIARLAPRAAAELQLVFARRGQADFVEVSQGALRALGHEDEPTDLLLALDYRIRHILVDEFQDTSHSQYDLLRKLTAGWEPGDGRTLFLVGDPMQSIYRFREAEVALFVRAWNDGIGPVRLDPVTLSANFRSAAGIVEWVNASFQRIMPSEDDIARGAVKYAPSHPVHPHAGKAVHVHPFLDDDPALGAQVARIVQDSGEAGVAILVRNRSHLREVIPRLREANLAFRAIEIEPLGDRPVVQDLLALTRALSHLADRTAWLAVLRAPWCALTLADLTALCGAQDGTPVWADLGDAARLAALSADGRARVQRLRDVLATKLAERRRGSLRAAVESAWLALGGPACVERTIELDDAEIFLDHLEDAETAGALDDPEAFEASIEKLFALPDLEAPERLQVMTIHKAKGLEFDVVIVPGLHAGTNRDDRRLFMWMETPGEALLLAPINAAGADDDPVYKYMRAVERDKADHESARLLYVAATRARRHLHLLGCAKLNDKAELREPAAGSLLRKLWPVVCDDFAPLASGDRSPAPKPSVPPASRATLRRLAIDAFGFEAPPAVAWASPEEAAALEPVEFSWAGDMARRIGSVVHRRLQRIAEDEGRGWTRERIERERPALKRELVARGVAAADIDRALERAATALAQALEDERGRWLLGPRRGARNEYRITTVAAGVRATLVIDRLFEDDDGRAWIVDYKTSSHEGSDAERFLDEEQLRYRDQLERYAGAIARAEAGRGLYFPMLKGWREW